MAIGDTNDQFWWLSKKDETAQILQGYVRRLLSDQRYRADDNLRHMRLYGNQDTLGFNLYQYSRVSDTNKMNRVTLNVIQSMADTVKSKITKNQPAPMYLTDGGDWSEQRKAKKLNQFTQGQFYSNKIYEKTPQMFLDACVFGTGALKVYRKGNDTCVERAFINEIIVEDADAVYGAPRQMHQGKWVHKEVLKLEFPKFKKQIEDAQTFLVDQPFSMSRDANMIYVLESWHLPSDDKCTDGRHVISIDNCSLEDEKYEKDYFPFVFYRWTPRLLGFYGQGLAEQLQGIQVEINKILRTIQISMHLVCIPRVLIEHGSKVVADHIDNKIGAKVHYTGTPPTFMDANGAIPEVLFTHLDRLYQRAFEIAGISQLSASSKKPSGLDSGTALRTFNDIESERFFDAGRRYEDAHVELGRQLLELARDIDEYPIQDDDKKYPGYTVQVPGKKFIKSIKLRECDLSNDRYIMQAFPVSSLAKTPAARLAQVEQMINTGMIAPNIGRKLLDFPDLEAEDAQETADIEDIEYTIDEMVDNGNYLPPEPYQNLELGKTIVQRNYLMFRTQGLPEAKLELLRLWLEDANNLLNPPPELVEAEGNGSMEAGPQSMVEDPNMAMQQGLDPATGLPIPPPMDPSMMPPVM
jgi:hypothetical protein